MTPQCENCLGYHGQARPCPAMEREENGPWNWLRSKLSVEDFQRLSYQIGCGVIRIRHEVRSPSPDHAALLSVVKGMQEALELNNETCCPERGEDNCLACSAAYKALLLWPAEGCAATTKLTCEKGVCPTHWPAEKKGEER